ncbi:lipocalin-like domain-containing protein [Rhodococcus sp. NPDC057014]|uniref:lipocalin-like domain-containing protein n=1 Tax=Rhodococcus sp. NPDC057014 TaxID=3346000 RepID=UPI0036409184
MELNPALLPTLVDWPRDEAAHEGVPWEIWWITTILTSGERRLAAHLTLQHLESGEVIVVATIADLDEETGNSLRVTAARGESTLTTDHLETTTKAGRFSGSFSTGYEVHAELDDGNSFDLVLNPTRPVLFNAGAGQYKLGAHVTTQYSIAGLEATGTIRLGGQAMSVTGHGWYDRQWMHSGTVADIPTFSWFGICLEGGETISLFDTSMNADGGHTWATIMQSDGTHVLAAVEPVAKWASGTFGTPQGRTVPREWRLVIPERRAELTVVQRMVEDTPGFFFYSGALEVTGSYDGADVAGYGFCDLVGWPS